MDTKARLQKCVEKLDYTSNFPTTLHINPSTNFIWQQIINNLKPKQEVEIYRKNIIIDRIENVLSTKSAKCPVAEIKIYNQLQSVRDNIVQIKARIQEKQNKHNSLHNSNKANYLVIESMKQKNDEKRMKLHGVKLKSKQYEDEIKQVQQIIDKKEISSISGEMSLSYDEISEHLRCLIEETEKCCRTTGFLDTSQLNHTPSFQRSMSSIMKTSEGCFCTGKKSETRFNELQRFVSCNNLSIARALFTDNFEENNRNAKNYDNSFSLDSSGGLLPESCFNFKADDEFLMSFQLNNGQKRLMNSELNLALKKETTFRSVSNIYWQCNLYAKEEKKQKNDYFSEALTNRNMIDKIEELFYNGNRDFIWNALCSLLENIRLELESCVERRNFENREICNDDSLPLNFIYIKNNLLQLKEKKRIKILKEAIQEKKAEIEKKLNNLDQERIQALEFYMQKIKLEGAIHFLHKEVYSENQIDNRTTLKTLKTKINKSRNELLMSVEKIGDYIQVKENLMEKMKKCQEDTTVRITKLNKFLFNPSWADALYEDMNSKEMEVFQEYPLDHIKQFYFIDKNTLYRDSMKDFSLDHSTPNDILYELTALLQHPQYPPEKILNDILRKINKMQILSSLKFPDVSIENKQYSLQEFEEQETYINTFCEKLKALIHSNKVYQVLKSSSYARMNMELWLDMPFKRFISQERIVDGKKYNEYEESFNYLKTYH